MLSKLPPRTWQFCMKVFTFLKYFILGTPGLQLALATSIKYITLCYMYVTWRVISRIKTKYCEEHNSAHNKRSISFSPYPTLVNRYTTGMTMTRAVAEAKRAPRSSQLSQAPLMGYPGLRSALCMLGSTPEDNYTYSYTRVAQSNVASRRQMVMLLEWQFWRPRLSSNIPAWLVKT